MLSSENFCTFVIGNNHSFITQNLKVVGPLGGKFDFFSPSGFEIQSDFGYRTSKIKFNSIRALKCYLNEKNLIHGRVTATFSKFNPQIFETYISVIYDRSDLARLDISLNGAHSALRTQENVAGVYLCEMHLSV